MRQRTVTEQRRNKGNKLKEKVQRRMSYCRKQQVLIENMGEITKGKLEATGKATKGKTNQGFLVNV